MRHLDTSLTPLHRFPGRAVRVEGEGVLYAGRGYAIHRSLDQGASWQRVTELPQPRWRRPAGWSRLASRLLRHEVRALARLTSGGLVASSRRGVYFGAQGEARLAESSVQRGEVPFRPPMRLGVGPRDVVCFGEYGPIWHKLPVRLFASLDGGASFQEVHRFAAESVGHVHNVIWDAGRSHYWVLVGDHGDQPGIGMLASDFQRFEWLVKGEQRFRAVEAFDLGPELVYGTDTELESNRVLAIDKASGVTRELAAISGSCIYAARFGDWYALSTTVEPSKVNLGRHAELWLSKNGWDWRCVLRTAKDSWHPDLFQYGSLVLPSGASARSVLAVSGQAVRGLDGRGFTAVLDDHLAAGLFAPSGAGRARS